MTPRSVNQRYKLEDVFQLYSCLQYTMMFSISWHILPDQIFGDIITMMGLKNLDELQKCRQVCRSWKVMTSQMTKQQKDTIRKKADSLVATFKERPMFRGTQQHVPEVAAAGSLAYHGMSLDSVWFMTLIRMDLSSVPAQHLASLVSCVTFKILIDHIENTELSPILDNLKCNRLSIAGLTLNKEETQALVRAMYRLERVNILGSVSLDISFLAHYERNLIFTLGRKVSIFNLGYEIRATISHGYPNPPSPLQP